jgi:DNA-binding NarL/FixJ family response regulator
MVRCAGHRRSGLIADVDGDVTPRVWIDDPHPIFRRGLAVCLQAAGCRVIGESSGLDPAPDLSDGDTFLFDVDAVGLPRAAALRQAADVRLVGIVRDAREEDLYATLTAGLAGVLLRSSLTPERLTSCLSAVVSGQGALPPDLLGQMISGLARGAPRGARVPGLARREVSVLRLLAAGDSTREIAETLSYSERTVKNIVHDLLMKLDCRTRAHAVALATRQGVI